MKSKIIIALDVDDIKKANKLIKLLWPKVKFFKIGLELINTGKAQELVKYINKLGGKVFYDAKLNDIPNTVAKASKVISKLGVWGFTVHASAGKEAIRAAVKNKGRSRVVGVTILTSIKDRDFKDKVIKLAKILKEEGVDDIVCSAQEVRILKRLGIKIIVPGIRPNWADGGDQKKTATPKEAIDAGADYLVIGRPITKPPKEIGSSQKALARIIKEIES